MSQCGILGVCSRSVILTIVVFHIPSLASVTPLLYWPTWPVSTLDILWTEHQFVLIKLLDNKLSSFCRQFFFLSALAASKMKPSFVLCASVIYFPLFCSSVVCCDNQLLVQNLPANLQLTPNTPLLWNWEKCRKNKKAHEAEKEANGKGEWEKHFFYPSVGLFSHLQVDGHAAAIHLRSPQSCGFVEGQNPKNRLHTRHFVSRHPSPASWEPPELQLGHGHSPKYIRLEWNSNTACIHTAFVLHLRRICCPFGRGRKLEPVDILMLLRSENLY